MEKLRLSLEELNVQSFPTTDADGQQRGTVAGHGTTDAVACPTVDPNDTCWASCEGTCESACQCASAGWTCDSGTDITSYGQTYMVTCCESWWGGC